MIAMNITSLYHRQNLFLSLDSNIICTDTPHNLYGIVALIVRSIRTISAAHL